MTQDKIVPFLTACMALFGLSMTAAGAWAAPQALAVVATDRPVQLACNGDTCSAEFTTFCLQPARFSPKPGTKYWLTEKSHITVSGTARDGRRMVLDARDALRFQSLRGHSAIQISLAPGLRKHLGLQLVSVSLAAHVTLAPEAVEGDDNPISAGELAHVVDALRPIGGIVVDRNTEAMAAARVTNNLVNLLPNHDADATATARDWGKLLLQARRGGLSPMAAHMAQNAYELCRYYSGRAVPGDMRRCMQGQHDRLMKGLNSNYWKAISTGS
ncbi:MAG: hypothetical protein O2967_07845 [Proteobacteria bacterium]|nr:hypothetical protein [Pseudomonadota bacterium]